jgi:hypothetical protein
MSARHVLALPTALKSVVVHRAPEDAQGSRLSARIRWSEQPDAFDGEVVDESGTVYVQMRGYRTVVLSEFPGFPPAKRAPEAALTLR